jgi:hypothetical protein
MYQLTTAPESPETEAAVADLGTFAGAGSTSSSAR